MTTYDIAGSIANRMRNAAEEKKIKVIEVNSWGSDTEVFASANPQEVAQWLFDKQAYGAPGVLDGGYCLQLPGDGAIFQGQLLDRWIDEHRVGQASSVSAKEDAGKSESGIYKPDIPVDGEIQSDPVISSPTDEGEMRTRIMAASRQGKSMLDRLGNLAATEQGKSMLGRLSDAQRQEFFRWMQDHPGINGMAWPGWAETRRIVGNQGDEK